MQVDVSVEATRQILACLTPFHQECPCTATCLRLAGLSVWQVQLCCASQLAAVLGDPASGAQGAAPTLPSQSRRP